MRIKLLNKIADELHEYENSKECDWEAGDYWTYRMELVNQNKLTNEEFKYLAVELNA